jgi:hypothetical protein
MGPAHAHAALFFSGRIDVVDNALMVGRVFAAWVDRVAGVVFKPPIHERNVDR